MQFIQKLFGLISEEEPIKEELVIEKALPSQNLDIERELFNVEKQQTKLLQDLAHNEQYTQRLNQNVKTMKIRNQLTEVARLLQELSRTRRKSDDTKVKIKALRMNKTRLEVKRLHLNLKHQINTSNQFMLGMNEVHEKIKSSDPKKVEESLTDTDRLIKKLSGDREAEELAQFRNLLEQESLRKQQIKDNIDQQQSLGGEDHTTSFHHRGSINENYPSNRSNRKTTGGLMSKNTMPEHYESFYFDVGSQRGQSREIIEAKSKEKVRTTASKPFSPQVQSKESYERRTKFIEADAINRMM